MLSGDLAKLGLRLGLAPQAQNLNDFVDNCESCCTQQLCRVVKRQLCRFKCSLIVPITKPLGHLKQLAVLV